MPDFLSDLSRSQIPVARKIAVDLLGALIPKHRRDLRVVSMFVPIITPASEIDADEDALLHFLGAEIELAVIKAVHAYSDWVACEIIRTGGYAARPFPIPDAVQAAAIAVKGDVTPSVVAFAVARMREMDSLPLLGRVDQGCLIPDQPALDRYKDCFDWSAAP